MVSALFFYQLVLVALVWLGVMLHWAWPSDTATYPTAPEPLPPLPKRTREPTPFVGLTHKPHCDACEHYGDLRPQTPLSPPPRLVMTRGRRRQVRIGRINGIFAPPPGRMPLMLAGDHCLRIPLHAP